MWVLVLDVHCLDHDKWAMERERLFLLLISTFLKILGANKELPVLILGITLQFKLYTS